MTAWGRNWRESTSLVWKYCKLLFDLLEGPQDKDNVCLTTPQRRNPLWTAWPIAGLAPSDWHLQWGSRRTPTYVPQDEAQQPYYLVIIASRCIGSLPVNDKKSEETNGEEYQAFDNVCFSYINAGLATITNGTGQAVAWCTCSWLQAETLKVNQHRGPSWYSMTSCQTTLISLISFRVASLVVEKAITWNMDEERFGVGCDQGRE